MKHRRREEKKRRRRNRVQKRLVVAHEIKDEWTPALKDAVAARNVANTMGVCPKCGATFAYDLELAPGKVTHATMDHESWCPVPKVEEAAA